MPRWWTGAELLFEVFSQRYERGPVLFTTNLPLDEWTDVFGSERPTGALLDRLTHHVHILEMNGDSYHLKGNRQDAGPQSPDSSGDVGLLTERLPLAPGHRRRWHIPHEQLAWPFMLVNYARWYTFPSPLTS